MSWVSRTVAKLITWVRSTSILAQSTADSWIDYYFSYAIDHVAQHASFEDDGDVRKLGVKASAT